MMAEFSAGVKPVSSPQAGSRDIHLFSLLDGAAV